MIEAGAVQYGKVDQPPRSGRYWSGWIALLESDIKIYFEERAFSTPDAELVPRTVSMLC
jgi:hypothetical protein